MSQVTPGPCPTTGCPAPTEIDCIWVDKVFGSCQTVLTLNATTTACLSPVSSVTCGTPTCNAITTVPGPDSFSTITYLVSVPVTFSCGLIIGDTVTLTGTTSATLYNPPGTTPACLPFSVSCTASLVGTTTYLTAVVCLDLKTIARVQLLVPSYGYCVDTPCTTTPQCPAPFPT